jgi:phosphoserine phosphatase RsbU/P
MLELNGYEVLERLKTDDRLQHVPVIMISAVSELDSVVRCIELGAEDYLAKPFNPVLLNARVGASLEKKRLRDATAAHLARIEAELDSAREIQLGLVPGEFPPATPEAPGEVFALLKPARQVGGDLYDFFYPDRETLCAVVADVSDKGTPAALFMAHASSMIRVITTLLRAGGGRPGPAEIIGQVNRELCRGNRAAMFVTVFLAMIDLRTFELSFCAAGHPKPYVIGSHGVARVEGPTGIPVGIEAAYEYETGMYQLARGDALFLYTDGVTEAMNGELELYSDERLLTVLEPLSGSPPKTVVEKVMESVAAFAGDAPQADDIAAMAIRV